MSLISGRKILLSAPSIDAIDLADIAHSLNNICRFNGHVSTRYTVLQHSIAACKLSDEEHKVEALLHDAAEAYIGDIIVPVKELFPEIAKYEDMLAGLIFQKYAPSSSRIDPITGHYVKSPYLSQLDRKLANGESFMLRENVAGKYDPAIDKIMTKVAYATPDDFIELFNGIGEVTYDRH